MKAMLLATQNIIFLQVLKNVEVNDVLKYYTANTCKRYWAIIQWAWQTALFQRGALYITASTGATS